MRRFTLLALLGIFAMTVPDIVLAQTTGSTSISTSFNSTSIAGYSRTLWFSAAVHVTGAATYPLTIYFHNQTISSSAFSYTVADGELILDPGYTHAVCSFSGGKWVTTSPPNEPGNYFIAALGTVPASTVPSGLTPVTWSGTFSASRPGIGLCWQWWAATYPGVPEANYEGGMKPSDCSSCSQYPGSDLAGSPELLDYSHDRSGLTVYTGGATGYTYTDSATVTAGGTDLPTVSITASATTVCPGDSVTFTAHPVNGGATPSYQWKIYGTNVGTNSPTFTYSGFSSIYPISVVMTSSDSLAITRTAVSNPISINTSAAPTPASITGAASLCAGGSASLSASTMGGVWSSDNAGVATVSSSGTLSAIARGTAAISYTLANSCGSAVATKTVTVISPGFDIAGTVTNPTCNGYTNGNIVTHISHATIPGDSYTYAWNNGSTSLGLWGAGAGTYTVTATNSGGCTETTSFTITQPEQLASSYSVTDDYTYGGVDNGAVYYGVSGGTWPYTYSWNNGATTQNITGLTAGTYVVTATDANSCTITNWFPLHETNGAGRMASPVVGANSSIVGAAYPNPFSSETTISFAAPDNGNTIVDVYSAVTGGKVATIFNEDTHSGQNYTCTLSGDKLASGVYLYKIISGDKNLYTGKVALVK